MSNTRISTPQEQERACLAGFIKWPDNVADYASVLKPTHFDNKVHAAIFSAILSIYAQSSTVDKLLVVEKLTAIGLKSFEDLNIIDYIDCLSQMEIREQSLPNFIANVIKYDFARKADKSLDEGKVEIRSNIDKSLPELANVIETTLKNAGTENVADEEKPIDVFSSMQETVLDWANNPRPVCLKTPFPIFTKMYGGPSFGDLFVIAAGPKVGKSTFVNFLAYEVAGLEENNCLALVLDTELETDRIIARNLSAISGVNEYKIKTGKFLNNPIDKNKVYAALNSLEKYKGRVHHKYVANKSIDEVISIAKRWYVQNVKNGENVLLIYDYLKSTQENITSAFEGYELLGQKTDKLKKLVSALPRTAGLTAVQTNRSGGTAMSSQIEWHCSNMYRLEKKTPEEIGEAGKEFGTHKLIEVRARVQGEEAMGADNYVKRVTQDGEVYVENYINFKVDNFKVMECGNAEDVFNKKLGQLEVSNNRKYTKNDFI